MSGLKESEKICRSAGRTTVAAMVKAGAGAIRPYSQKSCSI